VTKLWDERPETPSLNPAGCGRLYFWNHIQTGSGLRIK